MSLDVVVNLLFVIGAACFTTGAVLNLARSLGWL
jgi:hypothetical protein